MVAASTPWPIQTGWVTTFACTAEMSGNAVTTRVAVTREIEKDVKVVEGLDTVTGIEVVNVVKVELRDTDEEVALVGMGEVDNGKPVEDEVRAVEGIVEGIAEEGGSADGDEGLREAVGVCVGRKVEPSPVVAVIGGG